MLLRTELRMLLRAPWRTALLCVLLAAAVGAASLGGGLLAASDAGMAEIAEKYTTIAVFTKQAESDWKVLRKLKELAEQTEHGAMDRRVFCRRLLAGSAYCDFIERDVGTGGEQSDFIRSRF